MSGKYSLKPAMGPAKRGEIVWAMDQREAVTPSARPWIPVGLCVEMSVVKSIQAQEPPIGMIAERIQISQGVLGIMRSAIPKAARGRANRIIVSG